ncbi:MAG: hypothetical protein INH41_09000 [Myxococcaceae bacterium]|jgi:hypothetical protein|nr:hypothetical protein [Myxococcaceae bacterium]
MAAKKPEPKLSELDAQLHAMLLAVGATEEADEAPAPAPAQRAPPPRPRAAGWGPKSK